MIRMCCISISSTSLRIRNLWCNIHMEGEERGSGGPFLEFSNECKENSVNLIKLSIFNLFLFMFVFINFSISWDSRIQGHIWLLLRGHHIPWGKCQPLWEYKKWLCRELKVFTYLCDGPLTPEGFKQENCLVCLREKKVSCFYTMTTDLVLVYVRLKQICPLTPVHCQQNYKIHYW